MQMKIVLSIEKFTMILFWHDIAKNFVVRENWTGFLKIAETLFLQARINVRAKIREGSVAYRGPTELTWRDDNRNVSKAYLIIQSRKQN